MSAVDTVVEMVVVILDAIVTALGPDKAKSLLDERVALAANRAAELAEKEKFGG